MRPLVLLLASAVGLAAQTADEWFDRGMAHGREERWELARQAFLAGRRLAPEDPRFPTELAGVAFRTDRRGEARRLLRRALALDPSSDYAWNFLGVLRLLDGNLEAALAAWNRIRKPRLAKIDLGGRRRLDPVLLDRALVFSPATLLETAELVESEARLEALGVLPARRWELRPAGDASYELQLRAVERHGYGPTPLIALAGVARGLPFQTLRASYWNIGGRAANLRTLARWDARKRRAAADFSAPLAGEARLRWRAFTDVRDEEWDLASGGAGRFDATTGEAGFGVLAVQNAAFDWGADFVVSRRAFDNDFQSGWGFATDLWLRWRALRLPARRLFLTAESRTRLGRLRGDQGSRYVRIEERLRWEWLPVRQGDRWRIDGETSAGTLLGEAPFDELFTLGLDRDGDRRLRGLAGLDSAGRKGAAPVGKRYWLAAASLQRRLATIGFLTMAAGPFFDIGRTFDPRPGWGADRTQLTGGVELRLEVAGIAAVSLLYGRNLRTGSDVWFGSAGP